MGKKIIRKVAAVILTVIFTIGLIPADSIHAAQRIRLNRSKVSLQVGDTKRLKVKNTEKKAEWSSNKKSVAVVNKNGKITAVKSGKAVITAKVGKQRLKCTVTVHDRTIGSGPAFEIMNGDIIWTVSCNDGKKNSVRYVSEAGEWKRPLGLYSYAANSQNFFVDDSANERIIWCQKEAGTSYITLQKGIVCVGMSYNETKNTLFLLLFDNAAVEPQGVSYCKVELSKGLKLQEIGMKAYGTVLNEAGKPVSGSLDDETSQNLLEETAAITGHKMDRVDLNGQTDNYKLYICRDLKHSDSMRLLIEEEEKIIAYTDLLYVGEFLGGVSQAACIYEENGKPIVNYIAQDRNDEHKLMVVQPKMLPR